MEHGLRVHQHKAAQLIDLSRPTNSGLTQRTSDASIIEDGVRRLMLLTIKKNTLGSTTVQITQIKRHTVLIKLVTQPWSTDLMQIKLSGI